VDAVLKAGDTVEAFLKLWRTTFRWGWGARAVDEKLDGRLAQAVMTCRR